MAWKQIITPALLNIQNTKTKQKTVAVVAMSPDVVLACSCALE